MTYWYLEAFNEHLLHKINLQNLSVKALVNPAFIDNTYFFQMLQLFLSIGNSGYTRSYLLSCVLLHKYHG